MAAVFFRHIVKILSGCRVQHRTDGIHAGTAYGAGRKPLPFICIIRRINFRIRYGQFLFLPAQCILDSSVNLKRHLLFQTRQNDRGNRHLILF